MVKMISFCHEKMVIAFLLDTDSAVSTNISIAEAIGSSLANVYGVKSDGNIIKEKSMGLHTDAGGGVTREGLASELNSVGRTYILSMLLFATCCLHVVFML